MDDYIKEPNIPKWYGKYDSFKMMMKDMNLHFCNVPEKMHAYGYAIDYCYEDVEGYLFVSNGEYGSQVNFCPMCGYKAKKDIGA